MAQAILAQGNLCEGHFERPYQIFASAYQLPSDHPNSQMGTNVFGFCAALAFLSAPGITALHLKLNTTEENKPSCEVVMKELTEASSRYARKVKCEEVFAGGGVAPWAAKFALTEDWSKDFKKTKKNKFVVVKKVNLDDPGILAGASGEKQFENEHKALQAFNNDKKNIGTLSASFGEVRKQGKTCGVRSDGICEWSGVLQRDI